MSSFVRARSLSEALDAAAQENSRILAGGTDLMLHLRQARLHGHELPSVIVDVSQVPELRRIDPYGERPYVGAAVSFRELQNHQGIIDAYGVLSQAAASVGSPQVRSTATIGGNAANASPAADGVTALTALGAVAHVVSKKSERLCPLAELITAPNRTTLVQGEVLLGFYVDTLPLGTGQVFSKVGRRQAVSVARLNLAVCLDPGLENPRISLGACFPSPRRLDDVERLMAAGEPGPELWRVAGEQTALHFTDVCGWRSSATYKVPAIQRVVASALAKAWSSAGEAS